MNQSFVPDAHYVGHNGGSMSAVGHQLFVAESEASVGAAAAGVGNPVALMSLHSL